MLGIIDGDPLVYIVGFGHNNMPLSYQCQQMDEFVSKIIETVGADDVEIFLTGKGNFRFEVATIQPYKGQRDSSHRPRFYKELREYLIHVWDADLVEGMEADDACGIRAYELKAKAQPYTICTIDKDLLMLEGRHYNYKRGEFSETNETEGWRRFYLQTLTGDASDNIPGLFKVTGTKATKGIKEPLCAIEVHQEMDDYCRSVFLEKGATELQYREIQELLWILREPRTGPNFISEESTPPETKESG